MPVRTFAKVVGTQTSTHQSQPIPGREAEMERNAAGAFAFSIDDWKRLDRFLILGSELNFYTPMTKVTKDNAAVVRRCLKADGPRTVARIAEIARTGRAPKQDAGIIALALAAKFGDEATKHVAYGTAFADVLRTGANLFSFAILLESMGGWGHGARKAVGRWYTDKQPDRLAYQMVKYRQRGSTADEPGFTHRDLLRLSHPKPQPGHDVGWLLRWAAHKTPEMGEAPRIIEGFERIQHSDSAKESARLIREYRLPRECVPLPHLNDIEVWDALLDDMPLWAMVRNLGNMAKVGLLKPFSDGVTRVDAALRDPEKLRRSMIHPMTILLATRQYQAGRQSDEVRRQRQRHRYGTAYERQVAARDPITWSPIQQVVDALDDAFYAAVPNVPHTGKRFLLAIDASGSMRTDVSGMPITAREAAVAMALITAKAEPNHYFLGFTGRPIDLKISPSMRLDDAVRAVEKVAVGEDTDCAVPMQWLEREGISVDAVTLYTDGETWAGKQHPYQAIQHYRKTVNSTARLVQCAFVATGTSLTAQDDPLSLDCVGLDANLGSIIQAFCAGEW